MVILGRVALGVVLHVVSYCIVVSAYAASHMVGYWMGVAAACTVLYVVGCYVTMTVLTILHAWLGMLLHAQPCLAQPVLAIAYEIQQLL